LVPGRNSNLGGRRTANHVYVTATPDAATWGPRTSDKRQATGEARDRIYIVKPMGALGDDPNVTELKFPGNPTPSYRTRDPVKVVGELTDWTGHSPYPAHAMREGLAEVERHGRVVSFD